MRIVSGAFKGRKFAMTVPPGVRPTQDSVRESIFNVLNNLIQLDGKVLADIFAGTGGLGLEALSRGAEKVFFFEKNRKTLESLVRTCNDFKLGKEQTVFVSGNAEKSLSQFPLLYPNIRFDLVMSDPPYEMLMGTKIMNMLADKRLLNDNAIVVIESSAFEIINISNDYKLLLTKDYGETKVTFFRYIKNLEENKTGIK